jgi:adsorption protein B
MVLRMVQRIVFVGMVYGVAAGLLSIPRLAISNIINGLAAFRALQAFARSRQGKAAVKWDNTDHLEGVGSMPSAPTQQGSRTRSTDVVPTATILRQLESPDVHTVVAGLEAIPRDLAGSDRHEILAALYPLVTHKETSVRAALARVLGFLTWPELTLTLLSLLHDRQWVVRANCAKALLKYPNFEALMESALMEHDPLVREVLVRSVEQNRIKQESILPKLSDPNLAATRTALVNDSSLIREMYLREVGMTWDEFLETELEAA